MILGMPFLSKFKSIINLGKQSVCLPKLGVDIIIYHPPTLSVTSSRRELIKDGEITEDPTDKIPFSRLDLKNDFPQADIKDINFDPIKNFQTSSQIRFQMNAITSRTSHATPHQTY